MKLRAVAAVFQLMASASFHLYTDSHYIARALQMLETVPFIETNNTKVQELFGQIQKCLHARSQPCFVGHIRAHTGLPGPLALGNDLADKAMHLIGLSQLELAQGHVIMDTYSGFIYALVMSGEKASNAIKMLKSS